MLKVICQTTGLGFAAVAHITGDQWIACAVRDELGLGVKAGSQLALDSTLCYEVHVRNKEVVIDNIAQDAKFGSHPAPALYGFQSYISVPIFLKTGDFFGTLCALDSRSAQLNNEHTINMFKLFSELIAFYLSAQNELLVSKGLLTNEQGVSAEYKRIRDELELSNEKLADTNAALLGSKEDLHVAVEAAGLATWDYDPVSGRFKGNSLTKAWFGLQPDDEIELHEATDVIAEPDRETVLTAIRKAMVYESGGNYDVYYTIINPLNPIPRIVRAKGKALFNDHRQATRLSGVLLDVTELKQDELRKNDFIGMVSHELKTPLTSLGGYLQILKLRAKRDANESMTVLLDKAGNQIAKMSRMIHSFLTVARLESGKIHLDEEVFDIEVLVEEIVEESRIAHPGHQLNFSACTSTLLQADRDKIGQVITNFISNAVKYAPQNNSIDIVCMDDGELVELRVSDYGVGISEADKAKLFDRFYRVKNAATKNIAGFGIGLYLCSEIIERHKGKIGVESTQGKGSTFYFKLPKL
ncbi:hypothetical protein GCM10027037_02840 [Mucilaginibacter koreensis]